MMLQSSGQRAIQDLLTGERVLRSKVELTVRDLRQLLLELAVRFDGQRLEAIRRDDPSVPSTWSPADWRQFFSNVYPAVTAAWEQADDVHQTEREWKQQEEGYKTQIRTLTGQLALAQQSLKESQEKAGCEAERAEKAQSRPAKSLPRLAAKARGGAMVDLSSLHDGMVPPPEALVEELMRITPKNPPAVFNKGGRRGGDLTRAMQRYWMSLHLIGQWRLSVKLELEDILSATANVSAGSGSLRRVLEDLEENNLVNSEKLEIGTPRSALKLLRLTEDGKRLYKQLRGVDAKESEWERLIRLRKEERCKEYILAVLIFAIHARKRGWAVQVLPEGPAKPDLQITRGDESYFVMVDLGDAGAASWQDYAGINHGKVALCAATPDARTRLVHDCKSSKLPGLATDLETLIKAKYVKIDAHTPLWVELW